MEQAATVTVSEGAMLSLFAYFLLVVIGLLAAILIRGIVFALAGAKRTRERQVAVATPVQVAVAPEPAQIEDTSAHVAAIAAAIYAVVGAHRLIHIGEPRPSYGWTTTGRVVHQTSHSPKRAPRR
jgi:hypothetical protein